MSKTEPAPETDAAEARLARALAEVLVDAGLTELEMERDGLRIRLSRAVTIAAAPAVAAVAPAAAPVAATAPAAAAPAAAEDALPSGEVIKSPMVGTVYLQPSPGSPPFARVGDQVNAGQTLLLVEAMKTMNPITAPRAGVLKQLMVADAQPVEYGEALAIIG